ncbi:hypothetical protein BKA61DRAFT_680315 [Leptodontidium sp. MPI-SDFR-AT-0119]|nr:hypothetical protein BKA61DRAFT_680315 [Leptodontidium sp. MPI-SDFR-AT-0119]
MATTITLTGSPEEQANILKMLTRYGLVNTSNEITPDQAASFYTYANSNEQEVAKLEEKLEEQRENMKTFKEQEQEAIQLGVDIVRLNRKHTRCLAAKRGTIRTLRAIIDERNANIDFVEGQVVDLENKVAYLNKKLSKAEELRRVMEMKEEARDLKNNRKIPSDRMTDLVQSYKVFEADLDRVEKKVALMKSSFGVNDER